MEESRKRQRPNTNGESATISCPNPSAPVQPARSHNFDHHCEDVRCAINETYSSLSSSKAYDMAFNVYIHIAETIRNSGEEACTEYYSFGTKRSGLETLRKIGKYYLP